MIDAITWMVIGLFGAKIIWNMVTPFVLAWRAFRSTTDEQKGISMAPFVEFALLALLIVFSALGKSIFWLSPARVALWGGAIIIGSYLFFIVFGIILGWVVAQIKK